MPNFLSSFPDKKTLLNLYPKLKVENVNAHIHTPYSFSSFASVPEIFSMTVKENIKVLGINDFFVTDGYNQFYNEALKAGVFPLFNIEFIGLLKEEQKNNIRVNDPNNPGRCYLTGKGLNYPFSVNSKIESKLGNIINESQEHVKAMIAKANIWFFSNKLPIQLDYNIIKEKYAKNLVRERHIAKAIRIAVFELAQNNDERKSILKILFANTEPFSNMTDHVSLENEIRGNLLKAGGKAFVEENESTFLEIKEIAEIIIKAGGIPCYPVLLDDKKGNYTEFEKNAEALYQRLISLNIGCIELVPGRNSETHLIRFVEFFENKGFVILMGTEHNTPDMIPLTCSTRENIPLNETLMRISYEGSAVVAAHMYLNTHGEEGFLSKDGTPKMSKMQAFISLGNAVIHYFLDNYKK